MAIIGRDEEFDRTANTKQITGDTGQPLRAIGDDVLTVATSPGSEDATVIVDEELSGTNTQLTIEKDENFGANVAHVFLQSQNGDRFRVKQEVPDDDNFELEGKVHAHTAGATTVDTVIPLFSDNSRLEIGQYSMGDAPEIKGAIHFTSGDQSGHTDYNMETFSHGSLSVSTDGETDSITQGILDTVPHGYKLMVMAHPNNTGIIHVGSQTYIDRTGPFEDTDGVPLEAGAATHIRVTDAQEVVAYFPNSADEARWSVETATYG